MIAAASAGSGILIIGNGAKPAISTKYNDTTSRLKRREEEFLRKRCHRLLDQCVHVELVQQMGMTVVLRHVTMAAT